MKCLLVFTVALVASGKEMEGHSRHWQNYLNGLLAQLSQESPKPDQRHELWKQLLSGRVRSFLVSEDEGLAAPTGVGAQGTEHFYYGDKQPLNLVDGRPNGDWLNDAWRKQVEDTLLARPALIQRNRHTTTVASPVKVFSPYRRSTTRRITQASRSSNESHHHRYLDILNAHGARNLREPPLQPLICHCSSRLNGSENGTDDILAELATSTTTSRQPPLLLVVPALMMAPRDGPFAIVMESKTTNASASVAQLVSIPETTPAPSATFRLRRHRLRFVLLLVVFILALSASLAYYMSSYLVKYKREYDIIRSAQFL